MSLTAPLLQVNARVHAGGVPPQKSVCLWRIDLLFLPQRLLRNSHLVSHPQTQALFLVPFLLSNHHNFHPRRHQVVLQVVRLQSHQLLQVQALLMCHLMHHQHHRRTCPALFPVLIRPLCPHIVQALAHPQHQVRCPLLCSPVNLPINLHECQALFLLECPLRAQVRLLSLWLLSLSIKRTIRAWTTTKGTTRSLRLVVKTPTTKFSNTSPPQNRSRVPRLESASLGILATTM